MVNIGKRTNKNCMTIFFDQPSLQGHHKTQHRKDFKFVCGEMSVWRWKLLNRSQTAQCECQRRSNQRFEKELKSLAETDTKT